MILNKPTYLSRVHSSLPNKESGIFAFFHLSLLVHSNDDQHFVALDFLLQPPLAYASLVLPVSTNA
jgi:hypothetical protein